MTEQELSEILGNMYHNAPRGQSVLQIHLFGIRYGRQIIDNNYSRSNIIEGANINSSYLTELSKGIALSNYVVEI